MKEKVLDQMIWNITGAHGKYLTKYRSEEVLSSKELKINHEHVYTRKYLIKKLISNTNKVDNILRCAIGCVISVHEHNRLKDAEKENASLVGWQRYKKAGIRIQDMESGKEVKFDLTTSC
ncbi:hypothetical protein IIB79_12995 [candidate division KSB1 bacterium]|nr:hypothetical protein [candidate division KSB1 bacterium]